MLGNAKTKIEMQSLPTHLHTNGKLGEVLQSAKFFWDRHGKNMIKMTELKMFVWTFLLKKA